MKELTSVLLALIFLFTSCSERMVGVISSTSPQKVESSRLVISVDNYEVKSQNQFEFTIDRKEEVKYATTFEERQKWHNPGPYTTYPIMAAGFGALAYAFFTAAPSIDENGNQDNSTNIILGALSGIISFSGLLGIFTDPITKIKTVKK